MLITTRLFPTRAIGSSRAHKFLERNVIVYRRNWTIIVTGFFEPIFYLLGIGFGLGTLVGDIGDIPYAAFVAPGLMATAAMNGALFESTFNLFFKLKYAKTFDAILSTPLGPSDIAVGEVSWALTRGLLYAIAFLVVMLVLGLVLYATWCLINGGVEPAVAVLYTQGGGALAIILAERIYPYHERWLHSHADIATDAAHTVGVGLITAFASPLAVASGVAVAAWLSRWLGSDIWPVHWPLPAQVCIWACTSRPSHETV